MKKDNTIVATFVVSCCANMHAIHLKANGRLDFSEHFAATGRRLPQGEELAAEDGLDALVAYAGGPRINRLGMGCRSFLRQWRDPALRQLLNNPNSPAQEQLDHIAQLREERAALQEAPCDANE